MNELSFDLTMPISTLDKEKKAKEGEEDMSDLFKLRRAIIWWLMVACCQGFQDKLRQTRITLSPLPIIHLPPPLLLCSCKVMWFTSLWFTLNSWPDRSGVNIYVYLSVDLFEFACLYWPLIFGDLGDENQHHSYHIIILFTLGRNILNSLTRRAYFCEMEYKSDTKIKLIAKWLAQQM